jgi:predicted HTH transcriptional regulator
MTACQNDDVKVDFKQLKMGFAVVFHRSEKILDNMGRILNDKFIVSNGTISGTVKSNDNGIRLLKAISDNPKLTYNELAVMLSIPRRTVSREMKKLQENKKIEREGTKKNGHWIVKNAHELKK